RAPAGGGGSALRRPPLPALPVAPLAERPRGALRPRAPRIERQPGARAAVARRRPAPRPRLAALARVRPLVERQVPPAGGARHARLSAADDRRAAVGLRRHDPVSRLSARRPQRLVDPGVLPR